MTPWVLRLILANVLVFLLQMGNPALGYYLAFRPAFILATPWTVLTYMFVHASGPHLLFNMLSLFFFGPRLEERLGGRSFLTLYFFSGLMGALLSLMTPAVAIVGASGAVFGVTLGFARFWPRELIYLWGLFGIEARVLVVVMTVMSLWLGVQRIGNIAHFAHLGGFAGGYLYLRWLEKRSPAARWRARVAPPPPPTARLDVTRWKKLDLTRLHAVNREEYERVLAKLDSGGVPALTASEIEFLERFSSF